MNIIQKINKWDAEHKDDMNLRKIMPKYFNMWILRTAWILLLAILLFDFYLNGWHATGFYMQCGNGITGHCLNSLYVCQNDAERIAAQTGGDFCLTEAPPKYISDHIPINQKYLPDGFHAGRSDILFKYGDYIMYGIVILAFTLNHLLYRLKYKSWKYLGRKYHESENKV